MQDVNLHESRIEEISIYPGTLFVSTVAFETWVIIISYPNQSVGKLRNSSE